MTTSDTRRPHASAFEYVLIGVAVMFVLLGTYARSFGDTANSRLATVLSLTEHGTWYIDRPEGERANYFESRTIDKVMVNGRMLSSKPPMLPLLMTGEYVVMNKLFGLDLKDPDDHGPIIRYMSMTLIGGSYLLALIFFMKTLVLFVRDDQIRAIALFSLAFGTQLWGYGSNINNHVPGAAMVAVSTYFALGLGSGKLAPRPWRFAVFGLAAGLAPTLDMPAGIFPFIAGLYLLWKFPKQTLSWAAAAATIPLAVHVGIMVSVTGSPLPVQVREDLYLYESSYWRNPRGVDSLSEPKPIYLFHMTFGRTGVFSLYPILFAGIVAAVRAIVRNDVAHRGYILGGAAGFAILTAYYATRTNNYGGEAYGFRWYIVAMPVLMLMGTPLLAKIRARWKWVFLAALIGISFYSAWECSISPWGSNRQWIVRFLGRSYY